jgi:hypothetical protein
MSGEDRIGRAGHRVPVCPPPGDGWVAGSAVLSLVEVDAEPVERMTAGVYSPAFPACAFRHTSQPYNTAAPKMSMKRRASSKTVPETAVRTAPNAASGMLMKTATPRPPLTTFSLYPAAGLGKPELLVAVR